MFSIYIKALKQNIMYVISMICCILILLFYIFGVYKTTIITPFVIILCGILFSLDFIKISKNIEQLKKEKENE